MSRYVDVHSGLLTPLVIPWTKLAVGFAAPLLCLAAAVAPAIVTARLEPLALLQRGRDSS